MGSLKYIPGLSEEGFLSLQKEIFKSYFPNTGDIFLKFMLGFRKIEIAIHMAEMETPVTSMRFIGDMSTQIMPAGFRKLNVRGLIIMDKETSIFEASFSVGNTNKMYLQSISKTGNYPTEVKC